MRLQTSHLRRQIWEKKTLWTSLEKMTLTASSREYRNIDVDPGAIHTTIVSNNLIIRPGHSTRAASTARVSMWLKKCRFQLKQSTPRLQSHSVRFQSELKRGQRDCIVAFVSWSTAFHGRQIFKIMQSERLIGSVLFLLSHAYYVRRASVEKVGVFDHRVQLG